MKANSLITHLLKLSRTLKELNMFMKPGVVVHAYNPSTGETEAGRS
jgi:hypothetical protein